MRQIQTASKFTMSRTTMYGHYYIVKETTGGKITKVVSTDAPLYDDYVAGKRVQARLRRAFNHLKNRQL